MRGSEQMLKRPGESLPGSSLDPAEIAQGVRQIAHDLHQMLKRATSTSVELIELERRIDELRLHIHGTPLIAVDRWLKNSRSALRVRVVAERSSITVLHSSVRHCARSMTPR